MLRFIGWTLALVFGICMAAPAHAAAISPEKVVQKIADDLAQLSPCAASKPRRRLFLAALAPVVNRKREGTNGIAGGDCARFRRAANSTRNK